MSDKKQLDSEELKKVTGGVPYGSFIKHDVMYWVCPDCGAEISTSYTYIGRHLFYDHQKFPTEADAIAFAKTIDWWY